MSRAHKIARQFFQASAKNKTKFNHFTREHRACATSQRLHARDPPATHSPLRLLRSGLCNRGAGPPKKEMVIAPASLRRGLALAAQAHRYHFDRKHPADLNRGFGRQEEPRRNGSHLVCLSESERRRRLWRRRELLRSYISPELPPFPRPLPRPPSPPQATQPARLPADRKVRHSGDPLFSGSLPHPLPAVLLSGSRTRGGGRGREKAAFAAPRDAGRAASPGAPPSARPLRPGLALGQDARSLGPASPRDPQQMVLAHSAAQKADPPGRRGSPRIGGNPGPPRKRRRFERARSADRAAYSSGKNGCLGRRGIRGGGGGARGARSEGQRPSIEPGSGGRSRGPCPGGPDAAGGRRRARARRCCCSLSFFFFKGKNLRWEY